MKQFWSKSLACLLCLALLAGMLPVGALAEDNPPANGEVSLADAATNTPVEIRSAEDLKKIGTEPDFPLNGSYVLAEDIDLGGSAETPWTSIGYGGKSFTGTFDGAGHTISGLYLNSNSIGGADRGAGLFTSVGKGGMVRNLTVKAEIAPPRLERSSIGGVVGVNNGGTISSCTGSDGGAGIGGGSGDLSGGAGGEITISGGSYHGAGIGGGFNGAGGTITISGGTVTANGGGSSAGIGGGFGGDNGTFSTGDSGRAVIIASRIGEQSSSGEWRGVIFQGTTGQVYGSSITPTEDFTIPENSTLTIEDGRTLIISAGVTLTNNGTIIVESGGVLVNKGTIGGSGKVVVDTYYLDTDNARKEIQANLVTTGSTTWTGSDSDGGWYVVNDNVTISTRITVTGNVNLILADGCKLTASQGINVTGGNSLTIYAQSTGENMGTLTANGANSQAGIGGGDDGGAGGKITINGGAVRATGGSHAAGIGGGYADIGMSGTGGNGGAITINGGTVIAQGGSYGGAGIGGGGDPLSTGGAGGTIIISGGAVTATGSGGGAGIGGGSGEGAGGEITISGGMVNANGGNYAADIGGGNEGPGGKIIISGGTVTASSTDGTGIGGNSIFGDSGTFSTGENGCAVIIASRIGDQSSSEKWSGVIFQGQSGVVYGTDATPTEDFIIPENYTLTIEKGQTLTISEGITLTNNGTITVESGGALVNQGTIINNGTIQLNGGSTIQTGDGPEMTLPDGGTVDPDTGAVTPDAGGSVVIDTGDGTTTITPPSGQPVTPNDDGTVTVPDDSTVQTGGGPEMTLPNGGTIDPDTGAVMPEEDGSVIIGSGEDTTTITPPLGVPVTPNGDGSVTIPGGSTVQTGAGPAITIGEDTTGATVGKDGSITLPESGSATIGNGDNATTISTPKGGTIKPNDDGSVTIPGGSTVVDKNGDEYTYPPEGGTLDPDGTAVYTVTVTFDSQGGSEVASKDINVNNPVEEPAAPTRSGYSFRGWYTKASGGERWDFTKPVAADMTLYAQWSWINVGGPTYPPTMDEPENGAVTTSPSRPEEGDAVTITPKPDEGFEVDEILVKDEDGKEIKVTQNPDGTYTFTQPDGKVTIKATFRCDGGELCPDHHLTDVSKNAWYHAAVDYVVKQGIMEGMSATTFSPNTEVTRAQAVQILYNLEGQPDISDENLGYPYEDVNAQAWYGDAVYWARITGVATGYGDGTFQPTDSITRQEFAQMLYNYAKYKGYDLTAEGDLSQFPDSGSVADWAEAAMSWANGNELINGHDNGTIDAVGTAIRAQAASILMRFDENVTE